MAESLTTDQACPERISAMMRWPLCANV